MQMNKLKVIEPFGQRRIGDVFDYSEDTDMWVCESVNDNSYYDIASNNTCHAISTSKDEISSFYAKKLVSEGILEFIEDEDEDEVENNESREFVNVFDEMVKIRNSYENRLKNLDKEYKNQPACLKVESETVLSNMVHLLDHLISLRKLKK